MYVYILHVKSTLVICTTTHDTPELNTVELAHGNQVQVKNYVTKDLKLFNSHGMVIYKLIGYLYIQRM